MTTTMHKDIIKHGIRLKEATTTKVRLIKMENLMDVAYSSDLKIK